LTSDIVIDHLFRHQYGRMVAILTRIFGLEHLPLIEDAVQDTFVSAMKAWRKNPPDNPEAWLTAAAKNRIYDLHRQIQAEKNRAEVWTQGMDSTGINEFFLEDEIADSQLRMIFAACHPDLKPRDQIAFALKTISGFSPNEIASALLLKDEAVRKRLHRARKAIVKEGIAFEIPMGSELADRLPRVLEVVYLIFNEGFHSGKQNTLVREDLCGEALRLCKLLLRNPNTSTSDAQALFALFCFHASRLRSKVNEQQEVLSLKEQDRSLWYAPLIELGYASLNKAVASEFGVYHYEAAIAAEHVMARSYEDTNWNHILGHYQKLQALQPSAFVQLNMATVLIQLEKYAEAETMLGTIEAAALEQRTYLYHGLWAEYYHAVGEDAEGCAAIDRAIEMVRNTSEKDYLKKKRKKLFATNG